MHIGPNIVREDLALTFDVANTDSFRFPRRIYDYSIWEAGTTGAVSPFGNYSSRNRRVYGEDPWGNETVVWESYNIAGSTAGGGIYMNAIPVDNSKMYRMSFWEKRISNGDAENCRYYFGMNAYGNSGGVMRRDSGTSTTNPYFWNTPRIPPSTQLPLGEWVLCVGHVWPDGSGTGADHPDSGRYILTSGKVGDITRDHVWLPDTGTARARTLAIYQPDATTDDAVLHHSLYPRLDIVDGTEPSIDDLLNNNVDKVFDLTNNSFEGTLINGCRYEEDSGGFLSLNGVNDYIHVSNSTHDFDSISLWFKTTSNASEMQLVSGFMRETSATTNIAVQNGYLVMTRGDSQRRYISKVINDGKWHNLHVNKISSNNFVMYIDGQQSAYDGSVNVDRVSNRAVIGARHHSSEYSLLFEGSIGPLKVYNDILSSDKILQNYNAIKSRFGL